MLEMHFGPQGSQRSVNVMHKCGWLKIVQMSCTLDLPIISFLTVSHHSVTDIIHVVRINYIIGWIMRLK